MATILRDYADSPAMILDGTEDHIHALCSLSRTHAIMDVIQQAKTETSKWVKKQAAVTKEFAWQAGYGAFSVSESNIRQVRQYIKDQQRHHAKMSFQDEFRQLCRRHGLALDERYAWG